MKLLIFRVNNKKMIKKSNSKINFEKLLFLSFIFLFTLLVITQTILISPEIKNYISVGNQYEGATLSAEEYLYKKGEIGLQLQNVDSDEKLKVLLNGDMVGAFINKTLTLNVKDGDVIELDGSEISDFDVVKIISVSKDIITDLIDKETKITSGVKRLAVIHFK